MGASEVAASPAVGLRDVRVMAGKRCLLTVSDLQLQPGRLVAVLGPNGAGKSTLLGVMGGWIRYQGTCHWEGRELSSWSVTELACRRAVMMQQSTVAFDFTAEEVVRLGRYPHRHSPHADEDALVLEAMRAADVVHLRQTVLGVLSGGERARVHWARAWAQLECPGWPQRRPQAAGWLLLDEPTAALDLAHQHRLLALLRQACEAHGLGAVVVLHDLNLALRYAHEAVLVCDGTVCSHGAVRDVLQPQRIGAVWRVQARWLDDTATGLPYLVI